MTCEEFLHNMIEVGVQNVTRASRATMVRHFGQCKQCRMKVLILVSLQMARGWVTPEIIQRSVEIANQDYIDPEFREVAGL